MLMEDSILTKLHIFDIKPHPDNPRKDLGDLEELTESIRKNGVMQNLTVVPVDEDDPKEFICLIGHRRLAAAREAGIYEVPARICFGLSHREQVGIMLEENMQRNDLTIVEQAQGFQMMLDLGETEESIAEKTGFSRTTVRHRLQLAKLDQKELKKRQDDESFQLSLKDLYALEKVKDVKKRNEILKIAYSSNEIRRRAENAERDERRESAAAVIIEQLQQYGIKPIPKKDKDNWAWNGKYDKIAEFDLDEEHKNPKLDLKKGEVPYYGINYSGLCVVVPKRKTKSEDRADAVRKDRERRQKAMKQLRKQYNEDVRLFVEGIADGTYKPEDEEEAAKFLWQAALERYTVLDWSIFTRYLTKQETWNMSEEEKREEKKKYSTMNTAAILMVAVAAREQDTAVMDYLGKSIAHSTRLPQMYEALALYGYQPDKEEKQIIDGTHELYTKEEQA